MAQSQAAEAHLGASMGAKLGAAIAARPWLAAAPAILFGAALWLFSRPLLFSENDAQLYAFMALAWGDHARFGQDLFLKYGSQDSYSLFSPLYGSLIRVIGLGSAVMVLTLAGAAIWLAGSWRLLHRLLEARAARIAFLLICGMHLGYAGYSALIVGEGMLTSRIFAEGLVLLAFAELSRERWIGAGAAFLAAASLHPLMTLPGLGVAAVWLGLERRWILWACGGLGVAALAAAALGVPPADRLLVVMDGQWLDGVKARNGFVFISSWTAHDRIQAGVQAATLAIAAFRVDGWRRRLLIAILGVAAGALLVSFISADLVKSVLIIQLQLWRATWLLAWTSIAAVAMTAPESRAPERWVATALLFAAVVVGNDVLSVAFAAGALAAAVLRRPDSRRSGLILLAGAGAIVALQYAVRLYVWAMVWEQLHDVVNRQRIVEAALRSIPPLFILAAVLAVRNRPILALAGGLTALVVVAGVWDHRTPWVRYITAGGPPPARVAAPVLWGAGSSDVWFLLRTTDYVSLPQASGLLFSRQTAAEWRRRMDQAHGVVPDIVWSPAKDVTDCREIRASLSAAELAAICRGPDRPASVVLESPIPGVAPAAGFTTPVDHATVCSRNQEIVSTRTRRFWVYSCDR